MSISGWNVAPGWYPDPGLPGYLRYWSGAAWTTHVVPAPGSALPVAAPRQPRDPGVRALVTAGLILLVLVGVIVASAVLSVLWVGDPNADVWIQFGVTLALIGVFSRVATKVSYRWFDAFVILIPIYGLIWMGKIMWRIAYLPDRDWRPRPDEAPWAVETDDPIAQRMFDAFAAPTKTPSDVSPGSLRVAIEGGEIIFTRHGNREISTSHRGFAHTPSQATVDRARREVSRLQRRAGQEPWF